LDLRRLPLITTGFAEPPAPSPEPRFISARDDFHQFFLQALHESRPLQLPRMTHLGSNATSRTLTVVLSESEWQALRAVEPDAVGWLQERIRERLGTAAPGPAGNDEKPAASHRAPASASGWGEDVFS
jgi:hypothetical protein